MRLLLQRVTEATVQVDGNIVGQIGKGVVALLGIGNQDTEREADWLAEKLSVLRIFEDNDGKTNLSLRDTGGNVMIISQFTLYADCQKGTRPGFSNAAPPDVAESLYQYFLSVCKKAFPNLAHGIFGADMTVSLVNDGPFTVLLER